MVAGRTPTAAESRHMTAVAELGCIVCRLQLQVFTPCEIHHTDGKTKPGAHFNTIGLCYWHHRSGKDTNECTSRHPHKARFEERYGTEQYLLDKTAEILAEQ